MPQFIGDGATFNFNANPSDWPTLSCSQANLLALNNSDLQLDDARSLRLQSNGQLSFQSDGQISAQGALSLRTGAPLTERFRITTDGKVGIGTASPTQALEVNGAVKATDFIKGTTPLISSQWGDIAGVGINYTGGNVGIGKIPVVGVTLDVAGALSATSLALTVAGAATPAANFSPSAAGGLRMAVANATDEVNLAAENGGSFAHLDLHADLATAHGDLAVAGNLNVAGIIQGIIATGAIGPDPLAAGAVRTDKIADKAVTLSKLANGVLPPAIGVAVATGLQHGHSIPVPAGFLRSECIFFAALKFVNVASGGGAFNCSADTNGKITASPSDRAVAVGVALAKKGGW